MTAVQNADSSGVYGPATCLTQDLPDPVKGTDLVEGPNGRLVSTQGLYSNGSKLQCGPSAIKPRSLKSAQPLH